MGDCVIASVLPFTDPEMIFALLLLIALVAPLLAEKIKLPGIIGLILSGIFIGPHGFGLLERGNEIELLAMIGLLYIMFLAGLEMDIVQFVKHKNDSLIFGFFTFTIPLFLGTLMGYYLLKLNWLAAILLSTMFSSHTLITYPMVSKLGLVRHRAVTTTIGGTLITDTTALLFLAVIAAMYQGESGVIFWIRLFVIMSVYVALVLLILPWLGHWFFRNIASYGLVAFIGVLTAVFLCAYFAHLAGFEPIIGAFLAGLTLNTLIPEKSTLMNRVQFVGHSLFIPFFLISVGMLVNLTLLLEGERALLVAVSMVIAGIVTKWLAANISQKILSYDSDEAGLIFGLSVNQAAATLAAVLVGFEIGIFDESILTGTIIMILVTSLLGSWFTDKYARSVAIREEEKPYSTADVPQRILIPMANPENAANLTELAVLIRKPGSHEPLYPISVVEAGTDVEERLEKAEKMLGEAVVRAISANVQVVPITRVSTAVVSGIRQSLLDKRISTVILGWKGHVSSNTLVFGRTLDPLIENNKQMFLVSNCCDLSSVNTIKRVVVAIPPLIEHHPGLKSAILTVKRLTDQLGASLYIVSVSPTLKRITEVVGASLPKVRERYSSLDHWSELMPWLQTEISTIKDLVIILNVRQGRLAWQPNLTNLPRWLGEQFSKLNFMVIYPPEPEGEDLEKIHPAVMDHENTPLPPENIFPCLENTTLEEAIEQVLGFAFSQDEQQLDNLKKFFKQLVVAEPIELAPGVVLLHKHIEGIAESRAFLGINRDGWELSGLAFRVKALFLLVSPRDASPEIHLNALAKLVRPLHLTEASEEIVRAGSVEEVLKIFAKYQLEDTETKGEKLE